MKLISEKMVEMSEMILRKEEILDEVYERLSDIYSESTGYQKEQIKEVLTLLEEI